MTLIRPQDHSRYYHRFHCISVILRGRIQCTDSLTTVGRHIWAIISTVVLDDRKDCYMISSDLLAIAKFLVKIGDIPVLLQLCGLPQMFIESISTPVRWRHINITYYWLERAHKRWSTPVSAITLRWRSMHQLNYRRMLMQMIASLRHHGTLSQQWRSSSNNMDAILSW